MLKSFRMWFISVVRSYHKIVKSVQKNSKLIQTLPNCYKRFKSEPKLSHGGLKMSSGLNLSKQFDQNVL